MNKNTNKMTELVFILDKSGSMAGLESDTIGGFNGMIEKQKKSDTPCYVSTILFNGESQVIHDREKLAEIHPLTDNDYVVGGCTALIDAIGGAIHYMGKLHKYFGKSAPKHTMFVITTDGQENASHRYTSHQVKTMIKRQKEKYGWEFLFLGANIDAVETASRYGIEQDRAVNFHCDQKGTELNYRVLSQAIDSVRCGVPLSAKWKTEIEEDYQNRK